MSEHEPWPILLGSQQPSERLRGARLAAAEATAPDLPELRRRRGNESDAWVRSALDRAIEHVNQLGSEEIGQAWVSRPADAEVEDLRADAIQHVAQLFIHEVSSLVGQLEIAAEKEVADYRQSTTAARVQRLRDFIAIVIELEKAATAPVIVEFDLTDLISRTINDLELDHTKILLTRDDPVLTRGAPLLLQLALKQIIANAIEATPDAGPRVIVNCASTDRDSWLVVLDEGEGLPLSADKATEPGHTTKDRNLHFGWGLSIAQRAVHSAGGTISLAPRDNGGTSCEISWDITNEERDANENPSD